MERRCYISSLDDSGAPKIAHAIRCLLHRSISSGIHPKSQKQPIMLNRIMPISFLFADVRDHKTRSYRLYMPLRPKRTVNSAFEFHEFLEEHMKSNLWIVLVMHPSLVDRHRRKIEIA